MGTNGVTNGATSNGHRDPDDFVGWNGYSKRAVEGELKWAHYKPQHWDEDMIDIQVQYCGICASDISHLSEGFRKEPWPIVPGHEIVGKVIRVGREVTKVQVGQIVGVGAQADSCGSCYPCESSQEQYCADHTLTYAAVFKRGNAKGDKSWGGYADYHRTHAKFATVIPEGLDPALAAPMLCAGTTMFSPLLKWGAGKAAKDVGIIGVGGLGHMGILFAKAMGANVTAISHSESKKADAEAMGATTFIATHNGGEEVFAPYKRTLDLIIATTNDSNMPIADYLSLLRPSGNLILVGVPEEGIPRFKAGPFLMGGGALGGSFIGSPETIAKMFEVAAQLDVKPWIEKRRMTEANQAVMDMTAKKARYRYVLVNEANGGKMD